MLYVVPPQGIIPPNSCVPALVAEAVRLAHNPDSLAHKRARKNLAEALMAERVGPGLSVAPLGAERLLSAVTGPGELAA